MKNMRDDLESILYTEEALAEVVKQLGARISEDYQDKNLLIVGILKGSMVFMADLMRQITIPCDIDFLAVSSYGSGVKSSGEVRVLKDLDSKLEGKDLLLIEDILDSGTTLSYIKRMLSTRKPASVRICTLLDKPERRKTDIKADYVGLTVPNAFIVGYGLDYDQKYRNLPFIAVLKPEIYC
ncbi:MAG: hypoxanthine phosphoribosyltransferase [Clostridia bacterium]|nr:hypoxanthine phosphoribosyltransferase [Clostridia bacterium]